MKIEVWSDFACPASFIGRKLLQTAINCFGEDKFIEIEYRSYQLDPSHSNNMTEQVIDVLHKQSRLSLEECHTFKQRTMQNADDLGLTVDFSSMRYTNTLDAHRLTKYAQTIGKETELIEAMYHTYFFEQKDIGERVVLQNIAKEIDLDLNEVEMILSFNKYKNAVKEDQEIAEELGVDAVPFIIFNDMYALTGAEPLAVYINILKDILKEDPACYKHKEDKNRISYCIGNDCDRT